MSGKIYFISDQAGAIKIGFSIKPEFRLAAHQVSSANELMMLACVAGTKFQEKALHLSLSEHRVSGEWFRDCDAVRAAMDSAVAGRLPEWRPNRRLPHEVSPDVAAAQEAVAAIAKIKGVGVNFVTRDLVGIHPGTARGMVYEPPKGIRTGDHDALMRTAVATIDAEIERLTEIRDRFAARIPDRQGKSALFSHCFGEIDRLRATLAEARQ